MSYTREQYETHAAYLDEEKRTISAAMLRQLLDECAEKDRRIDDQQQVNSRLADQRDMAALARDNAVRAEKTARAEVERLRGLLNHAWNHEDIQPGDASHPWMIELPLTDKEYWELRAFRDQQALAGGESEAITGKCVKCGKAVKLGHDGSCKCCHKEICWECWVEAGHECPNCGSFDSKRDTRNDSAQALAGGEGAPS